VALLVVDLGLLALKIFVVVDAARHAGEDYRRAGKRDKAAWCALLVLGLGLQVVLVGEPAHPLNIVGSVPALVYLVDVRPALLALRRR
jgi:hypothetical protein